ALLHGRNGLGEIKTAAPVAHIHHDSPFLGLKDVFPYLSLPIHYRGTSVDVGIYMGEDVPRTKFFQKEGLQGKFGHTSPKVDHYRDIGPLPGLYGPFGGGPIISAVVGQFYPDHMIGELLG